MGYKNYLGTAAVFLLALSWFPSPAGAQAFVPQTPEAYPQQPGLVQQPSLQQQPAMTPMPVQSRTYSAEQIDQMVAPIALYPDPLISQILMASTYPLEIVEAQRWRQAPENATRAGDALQDALTAQPWDPSVKSLVTVPQVLAMMDGNIQWTEQLGDAFLASQSAIMDSVQRLRQSALAAGTLQSTPQQIVSQQDNAIVIAPAQPQLVYVPYYNPTLVYGTWPYPAYPPYYFPPPPGYVTYHSGLFGFGLGVTVIERLWGWDHWDWHGRRILVDNDRFRSLNHDRPRTFDGEVWEHDVAHRHNVPYRSPEVRAQFQGDADRDQRRFRGFGGESQDHWSPSSAIPRENEAGERGRGQESRLRTRPEIPPPLQVHNIATPQPLNIPHPEAPELRQPEQPRITPTPRIQGPFAEISRQQPPPEHTQPREPQEPQHQPVLQPAGAAQERAAPLFESFARGPDVRSEAHRGFVSRASAVPSRPSTSQQSASPASAAPPPVAPPPVAAPAVAPPPTAPRPPAPSASSETHGSGRGHSGHGDETQGDHGGEHGGEQRNR
ncbi:MAG: DUF3300 domain-containing protein [Pseudomonadota bacterium]|nr:DUF3300 domain-containing protein [Pseudomonadota bacterium]